jgi:hypothetical protein
VLRYYFDGIVKKIDKEIVVINLIVLDFWHPPIN